MNPILRKISLVVIVFAALFLTQNSFAQGVKGIVVDEDKKPLEFVSVALLQPADSLLVKYTSTGVDGKFEISGIKPGNYLFQIYLMTFQADQRRIDISDAMVDVGTVEMKREVNQLNEITVNAIIPIKIMQDTVAFNANAFKVRQDDAVEDLIKKLPGIQIGTDGTVEAQGENVTKILVDGKEFFNGDQTIALKNLNADAVKSVQIIDEESDDARTTGVKDGVKNKVINLVLKEGKKSGYFGKMGAGIGTEERYTTSADINRFTSKSQLAAFGNLNNINNTGATVFRRDGSRNENNSGYLTTGTAGANYNYEFKKDLDFNVDYHYGYSDKEQEETSSRTEFTDDSSFDSDREQSSQSVSNNHNLNFSLRDRSKEGAYLSLRGNFKNDDRESDSSNSTEFFGSDGTSETTSDRNTTSLDDRNNGGLNFYFSKKINDLGRNLRIRSGVSFVDNDDINYQESINVYDASDDLNRLTSEEITTRNERNKGLNYDLSVRYMEPIVEHHLISFSSSVRNELNDESLDQTRTINGDGQPDFIYDLNYKKQVYNNQIGYVFSQDKLQVYLSGSLETMKQDLDLDAVNEIDKKYDNFLPSAMVSYEYKKGKRLRFRYRKETRLPSAMQVSPVVNDFNPLFIRTGNIGLTPERSDNYNIFFYSHDFKKANNFFSFLNYTRTTNAFVTSKTIDDNRVQYFSYENFGSKTSARGMVSFGRKIKNSGIRYNVRISGNINDYNTMINGKMNETNSKSSSFGLSFSNDTKNVVDLTIGAKYDIDKTTYSLQSQDRDFFRQNYYGKLDWDLNDSFNFNSQFDYSLYTDNNFDSQSVPIWNMAVEYAFLNGKRGNLKLQVLDILDKNIGIVRTSTDNYFEESFRKNLGTYTMLSFTYSIKPPTGKGSKRGSDRSRWRGRGHGM